MVISTRKSTQSDSLEDVTARLQAIMEASSGGIVSNTNPNALLKIGDGIDETLDSLELMFEKINAAGKQMMADLAMITADHFVMSVKLEEALNVLDNFIDVSYDEALDHATADLMDALIASGAAESTDDGDLQFDPRITLGRGDLKPVLREAITRWVELKLQA